MGNTLNISNSALSNQASIPDYSISTQTLDSASGNGETEWFNSNAPKQLGYFTQFADLKSAITHKAIWNVGKGWTADALTKARLESFKGMGKDTFDDILFNLECSRRIYGDAFAEIIRDPETKQIINLKVLDSAKIKIIVDSYGIIKRYEQMSSTPKSKPITFEPKDILHVSNNRLGDQIHGISDIDCVEQTLLAEGESFKDMKKLMARQAKPLIMFKLGTDDPTKITAFANKMDDATRIGENIYIPDDANSVSFEVVQVTPNPVTMAWRDDIRKKFYRAIGLPELLPSGGGDSTESGGKIGYLSFEQVVEKDQRYWEQQIWSQLKLKINLIPPSSLAENLQSDNAKDPNAFQPSDMMAGVGR